ncbi:hypothetical protein PoB_001057200 [Plakobranchus ocellatus]|uniref:Uncharacterized protein n=1 Tax=Plakobranchus ocellatus TaxID=259542 RepID=A0AAV3YPL2_9GAST|nr:hypothetical protein PoB_001057200 [Plakobranchus ocellatus]
MRSLVLIQQLSNLTIVKSKTNTVVLGFPNLRVKSPTIISFYLPHYNLRPNPRRLFRDIHPLTVIRIGQVLNRSMHEIGYELDLISKVTKWCVSSETEGSRCTVDSESAVRSAGTLLSQVRAPPQAP